MGEGGRCLFMYASHVHPSCNLKLPAVKRARGIVTTTMTLRICTLLIFSTYTMYFCDKIRILSLRYGIFALVRTFRIDDQP